MWCYTQYALFLTVLTAFVSGKKPMSLKQLRLRLAEVFDTSEGLDEIIKGLEHKNVTINKYTELPSHRPLKAGDYITVDEFTAITEKFLKYIDKPGSGNGVVSSAADPYTLARKIFHILFDTTREMHKIKDEEISILNILQVIAMTGSRVGNFDRFDTSHYCYGKYNYCYLAVLSKKMYACHDRGDNEKVKLSKKKKKGKNIDQNINMDCFGKTCNVTVIHKKRDPDEKEKPVTPGQHKGNSKTTLPYNVPKEKDKEDKDKENNNKTKNNSGSSVEISNEIKTTSTTTLHQTKSIDKITKTTAKEITMNTTPIDIFANSNEFVTYSNEIWVTGWHGSAIPNSNEIVETTFSEIITSPDEIVATATNKITTSFNKNFTLYPIEINPKYSKEIVTTSSNKIITTIPKETTTTISIENVITNPDEIVTAHSNEIITTASKEIVSTNPNKTVTISSDEITTTTSEEILVSASNENDTTVPTGIVVTKSDITVTRNPNKIVTTNPNNIATTSPNKIVKTNGEIVTENPNIVTITKPIEKKVCPCLEQRTPTVGCTCLKSKKARRLCTKHENNNTRRSRKRPSSRRNRFWNPSYRYIFN